MRFIPLNSSSFFRVESCEAGGGRAEIAGRAGPGRIGTMPTPAPDGPGLFAADPFAGFGPSRFRPPGETPLGHRARGRTEPRLLRGVRASAPMLPGVYGMLDRKGRVVYVGKAKSLRARLLSYFRRNSRDPKAGRILSHTRTLVWEQTADEFAALLRELELIRRFRPRFNVLGQPGSRRYLYLCLGGGPAPYAYLTQQPTGKELGRYGPLVGRGRAAEAVRRVNDQFRLRDCTTLRPAFADQPALFDGPPAAKCLRFDINTCSGPCAGGCSRADYAGQVRRAKSFLDGNTDAPLAELTATMTAAAAALNFEKATAVRDRLQALQWLADRLTFLRGARRGGSFVYPLEGADGRTTWYVLHRGEVWAALRPPAGNADRAAVLAAVDAVFATPGPDAGGVSDRTIDSLLLVTAWFRKHRGEKAKLLTRGRLAG
jgi:excinuclease ABC subunit C